MTHRLSYLAFALALGSCALDTDARSAEPRSLTTTELAEISRDTAFSFLVGGHLYGDPSTLSAVPSPTFLAQLLTLRDSNDAFLVSLGDLVRAPRPEFLVATREVLNWLEKPVFHAPGNHDFYADDYTSTFGPSFGAVRHGSALCVVVDTESAPWNFDDEQLGFLERAVRQAEVDPRVEHVFFFGHRVVFAAQSPRYAALFRHCNGRDRWAGTSNFDRAVRPLLARLARTKSVTWFAGDLGVSWGFSAFFDRCPDSNVTFIGTGLGATPQDNLIRVHVAPGRAPRFELVALSVGATTGSGLALDRPLDHYGVEFWERHFAARD